MPDTSAGSVSIEFKANMSSLFSQVKSAATQSAGILENSVSSAFKSAKIPKIKVEMDKDALTRALNNMLSQLDNTNAKIYVQQQAVDELKRKWAAMGNLGTQGSAGGLALQQKILAAESALLKLQSESDTMALKSNAMESAINNFGAAAKADVEKVAQAATDTAQKVEDIGDAAQSAGNKTAKGTAKIAQQLSGMGKSTGSDSIEKRLGNIENNVQKTMRSVTALGRRFMVLFTGKLISLAFKGVADSMTGATQKSETLKNSMNTLTTAGRNVSNGVIAAVTPLVNVVAPILGNIAEKIRLFSNKVAMFVAAITGQKTVLQATAAYEEYGAAATGAASAAKEAQKTIAGFDTLNILNSNSSGGGGGGSGSGSGLDTDAYEEVAVVGNETTQKIRDALDKLRPSLEAFYKNCIEPFMTWTLSEGIPGLLNFFSGVAQWFADHPKTAGLLAGIAASLLVIKTIGSIAFSVKATVVGLGALGKLLGIGGSTVAAGTVSAGTLSLSATLAVAGLTVAALYVGGMLLQSYVADEVNKAWGESSPEHKTTIKTAGQTGNMEKFQIEVNSKKITGVKSFFEWYIGGIGDSSKYVEEHLKLEKAEGIVKRSATEMKSSMQTYFSYIESQSKTSNTKMAMNFLTGKNVTTETINAFKRTTGASWDEIRNIIDYNSKTGMTTFNSNLDSGLNQAKGKFRLFNNDLNEIYKTLVDGSFTTVRGIIDNMLGIPDSTNKGIMTNSKSKVKSGASLPFTYFATGGIVTQPTLAMIGEAGKEAVIPLENDTWLNNVANKVADKVGGAVQTINLTVQSVLDGRVIAESTTKYQMQNARRMNRP